MAYNVTCIYPPGAGGTAICEAQGIMNGWWFGASLSEGMPGISYSTVNGLGYASFSSDAYSEYLTGYIDSQSVYAYNMQGAGSFLASTTSYMSWPQWVQDYAAASPNFSVLGLASNQFSGGGTSPETLPAPITETPLYLKPYFPPTNPPPDATGPGQWQWNGSDWTWQAISMPPSDPPAGETWASGWYYQDAQGNWQWQHVEPPPPAPTSPPPGQSPADGTWFWDGQNYQWYNWNTGQTTPYDPGTSTGSCTIQDMSSFGSCIADNGGTIALAVLSIAAVLAVVYVARKGAGNVLAMLKPKKV